MDDALSVTVDECSEHSLDGICCQVLVHGLVRRQFLEQLAAWAQLHDQVHELLILVSFVILDDVRVVKGLQDRNLLVKRDDFCLAQLLFRDDLDGYLMCIVSLVLSLEDLAETARAEHLLVDVVLLLELMDACAGCAAGFYGRERTGS